MARPQPQWVIEEFGDFWIEAENYVSYGPFALKEWLHDESYTIIKNPFWPGNEVAPQSAIDEVQFIILDAPTALAEYEAGNMDYIDEVSSADIPRIKADPVLSAEYVEGTQSCTYYYGFGVGVAPMDNVHLRRALSYAVDRQDIVDNVTRSGQSPAPFFSNPSLAAAPLVADYPDLGISYDPDLALEELDLALADMGLSSVDELPAITLLFNTSEGHQRIAEAIQQMWLEDLGIEVQLINQEFGVYLDQRATFPVWRAGWCSDYPDNHNFLFDVFHSSSTNNDTGWSSEAFDALVEEAASLNDTAARIELYAQAETILVHDEAAMIPIYFYSDVELTKPYVERTYSTGGDQRFEKWDINN
jgi:oligopeptide transport system substrate-binding protein